jgi:hypothetical protein
MAEGNGEVSMEEKSIKQEQDTKVDRTEDYAKLVEYGLDEKVAGKLDEIYKTGTFCVLRLQHANFLVNLSLIRSRGMHTIGVFRVVRCAKNLKGNLSWIRLS